MNAVAAITELALPPSLQACNRSLGTRARDGHGFFTASPRAICSYLSHFAYTYRDTGATATEIPRLPPCTSVQLCCSQKDLIEVRCSAQINKKRGQEKEFQRRRGLPARRARAGGPESHRPPPGATPRGPGRSGFPATSQRGSEVYGPHIRAGHGRVRRVARVTARGGAVRDEDH